MDKDLRTLLILIAAMMIVVMPVLGFNHYSEMAMQEAANHQHNQEWELKVRLEEAKAQQMKYRALELGIVCQLVNKHGDVYTSEDC